MKTCTIDGCEKPRKAREFCSMHWQRWREHGDPLGAAYQGPEAAFLAKTEPLVGDPGCTIWTAATDRYGYGRMWIDGRHVGAHRYAWERVHVPIPDGMMIDHVCWEPSCVNVEHLRLATHAENSRYLSGVRKNGRGLPRGVYRSGRGYRARVKHDGTQHWLGTFGTVEEASQAAETKRAILFGEFAGGA